MIRIIITNGSNHKTIEPLDKVVSNGKYNLEKYFINGPLKVNRVESVNLRYAGNAFVYCNYCGTEIGFYINGLNKIR